MIKIAGWPTNSVDPVQTAYGLGLLCSGTIVYGKYVPEQRNAHISAAFIVYL